MDLQINCVLKDEEVILPKYETEGAVGLDIRAYSYSEPSNLKVTKNIPFKGYTLKAHQRVLVKTGLFLEIPEGYEAQVRARSGLALKSGITVLNGIGTIDNDFRGEIGVILINTSDKDFVIKPADRIGQLVFNEIKRVKFNVVDKLSETERGQGGYNSTGVK